MRKLPEYCNAYLYVWASFTAYNVEEILKIISEWQKVYITSYKSETEILRNEMNLLKYFVEFQQISI